MVYTNSYQRRSKSKKGWFILVFCLLLIGIWWYRDSRYQYFLATPVNSEAAENTSFTIEKGSSIKEIAKDLFQKELIINEDAFISYLKQEGLDRNIVAGRFMLNGSLTIPEIAKKITDAKGSETALTIPEGSTIIDIDKKLTAMNLISMGEFIKATKDFNNYKKYPFLNQNQQQNLIHPLEGFLFPDTYFLDIQNFNSEILIQTMLDNFAKKSAALENNQSRNLFEIVTMASILEKEVRTTPDLPIVAGILWKRLDENWQLGADATLLYLKSDRSLNAADLAEESPYNTRKNRGLPPGPINNPGFKALQAALKPESSNYYFYLTKPDSGEVVYAKTNDEHNLNKAKYLR